MSELSGETDLAESLLAEVVAHAEATYPNEACGLIVEAAGGALLVRRCRNLADELHAQAPDLFPRTSRTFFAIDPSELLAAEERGERVRVIYHSHPDVTHSLSAEDFRWARHLGEVSLLVVSVFDGVARGARQIQLRGTPTAAN